MAVYCVAALCLCMALLANDSVGRLSTQLETEETSPGDRQSKMSQLSNQFHSDVIVNGQLHDDRSTSSKTRSIPANTALQSPVRISEKVTCPSTWLLPKVSQNGSISCECGSDIGDIVHCSSTDSKVHLLLCYCMTFNVDGSMLVVGRCIYGCFQERFVSYKLESNTLKLNQVCNMYHREGQLCGKCQQAFALPVYSYSLVCVKCRNSNWVKYIATSILPLTLFFIIMVTFRVSVTSGVMNVFILTSQILSSPTVNRFYLLHTDDWSTSSSIVGRFIISFYGIWNLDFFRLLYPPFCLHPATTTVQILALDYIIAAYPLVLLIIAYILVKLHDSNVTFVVWLWKPFHRCSSRFRRGWNIKTSLIDSFATFLLLSYMKFLSVSFDLLIPVHIYNIYGHTLSNQYLFWDGTIEYFGNEHLPYAILALAVVIVFNILPLLLLCLYPSRRFHRLLFNRFRCQNQVLHTFMDAFQGCYKDGTNGNRDCRWFAGLLLLVRIFFLAVLGATVSEFAFPVFGLIILICLLLAALFQPYKCPAQNRANLILLFLLVFIAISGMANTIAYSKAPHFKNSANIIGAFSQLITLTYIFGVILYKVLAQQTMSYLQRTYQTICCYSCMKAENEYERLLPERMVNVEECTALLADPMHISQSGEDIHVPTQ